MELLIVVVIAGVLASIAIPNYMNHTRRAHIAQATTHLADMRVKLEQYFQDSRTFVGACAAGTVAPLPANTTFWTYTCPGATLTATTYTVTATGAGAMAGFTYSINELNTRSSTVTGVTGWSGNAACWVIKKGGIC